MGAAVIVREFGPPEVMVLEERAAPEPGPGQVRIRVGAAGVNPVDTYIRAGAYGALPEVPYCPGWDAAGRIDALGQGVEPSWLGRRVFTGLAQGAYAERTLCDASDVYALPEEVPLEAGAALFIPYVTAYRAMAQHYRPRAGRHVLVHGASGGVGLAALQWARRFGLIAYGSASSAQGRQLVEAQGARHSVDHLDSDHVEQLRALRPEGFDLVLEMRADRNLDADLDLVAPGGTIVVIGNRGTTTIDARKAMTRESHIVGLTLMRADRAERDEAAHAIVAALESDTSFRPPIARRFALASAAAAHRALGASTGARGQCVLLP